MIFQLKNVQKMLIFHLISLIFSLILLIFSSLNWYWTNSDILYILKHYKDQDTRFYFQIFYGFLTLFSISIFIGSIASLYSVIRNNKDIEYKLINDTLFIKYNIFVLKLINKNFNVNLRNNNEINISEIKEIKIDSPNKLFKNCLFIKLNNDETYPLFGLSDPANIKKIIENKIKEELNQDTESKKSKQLN